MMSSAHRPLASRLLRCWPTVCRTNLPDIRSSPICLLATALCVGTASISATGSEPENAGYCEFTPAVDTDRGVPGLIVGADVLLPMGLSRGHGVHIRFNGDIGAISDFDAVRVEYPEAAVLDCRGWAVLSPGFVNAHEHPAYSHAFPDPNLNPGYIHRDEWRLGLNGKVKLPSPPRYEFDPEDLRTTAILLAMELRHLLGGASWVLWDIL